MVTLKSHFPRSEGDSKLEQYLTQITLSFKSNGQHEKECIQAYLQPPYGPGHGVLNFA